MSADKYPGVFRARWRLLFKYNMMATRMIQFFNNVDYTASIITECPVGILESSLNCYPYFTRSFPQTVNVDQTDILSTSCDQVG